MPEKPPLGVVPEPIFAHIRAIDLARALHEYLQHRELHRSQVVSMMSWAEELPRRLREAFPVELER